MQVVYEIAIRAYYLAIRIAALFNKKAALWIKGRKSQSFSNIPGNRKVIWFHCASLGEFDQGLPLMQEWRKNYPSAYILVTFFSPSGMLHYHKRNHPADEVLYLPLDTRSNALRFVAHYQPETSIFVKYEFWHNFLRAAKESGSRIYSISTLLRTDQIYFKWYGKFFRSTLYLFDRFFVQNNRTQELLNGIGLSNVEICGDNRFDKVIQNKEQVTQEPIIELFKNDSPVFIIGSSWPIDEKILIPAINHLKMKTIIAPHQIDEAHIAKIESKLTRKYTRFTKADKYSIEDVEVLLLDTIGQLSNAYQYADVAYVGGGFTGKLHNILEPGVFGIPILIGPRHSRFPEAELFVNHGIAFEVSTTEEVIELVDLVLADQRAIRNLADSLIRSQAGASARIFQSINSSSAI